jgi:hypothetical protein
VLHDAERFAKVIHDALGAPRGGLAYSKARFRYLLEGTLGLRASIVADRGGGRGQSTAVVSAEQAHDGAIQVRETLLERLRAFAEGNVVRTQEIRDALGSTKDDDAILESLDALSKLVNGYLQNGDDADRALADSLLLDKALFADVAQAKVDLAAARRDKQQAGQKVVTDSPATNRIEGRVLFEMSFAMRLFEGAHARDSLSPRLIPQTGTRHVLVRKGSKAAAEDPAKPGDEAKPADGTTTGDATKPAEPAAPAAGPAAPAGTPADPAKPG